MKRFLIVLLLLAAFGGFCYWLGARNGAGSLETQRQESLAATATPAETPEAPAEPEEVGEPEEDEPVTFTPQSQPAMAPGSLPALDALNAQYTSLVDAVLPSVVNIRTTRTVSPAEMMERGMRIPFGRPPEDGDEGPPLTAFGSGVLISHEGHIVTNAHVVKDAEEIEVETSDEREFKGKVIGFDEPADIAVIKIEGEGLSPLKWGDSDELRVGEQVFAIGNPLGQANSVSHGIVSALGRNPQISGYEDFIQTNAAINPGNSGGALVNVRGELIGINTAIASTNQGFQGIGFAIPSNHARFALDSLITRGRVIRGWLGVVINPVEPELVPFFGLDDDKGVLVTGVGPGTPAAEGGLRTEDVILSYDGEAVETPDELRLVVSQTPVGKSVEMVVMRAGGPKKLNVTIGEQPSNFASMRSFETGEQEEPAEEPEPPQNRSKKPSVLAAVAVQEIDPEARKRWRVPGGAKGVVIVEVDPGSVAADAGLREGDVIRSVRLAGEGSKAVPDVPTFLSVANSLKDDQRVVLMVTRGTAFPTPVLLEPQPAPAVVP